MGKSRDAKARDKGKRSKGKAKAARSGRPSAAPLMSELLRLPEGPVDLGLLSTRATPGFSGDRAEGAAALTALGPPMETAQEKLFAQCEGGPQRAAGAAGDGHRRQGRGDQERASAWSIRAASRWRRSRSRPRRSSPTTSCGGSRSGCRHAGFIGVFNRSQYEDVLVVRVHDLVPEGVWRALRGDQRFRETARRRRRDDRQVLPAHLQGGAEASGCSARLDDPTKYWKYNPGDIDERYLGRLPAGLPAALRSCSTTDVRPGTSSRRTASGTGTGRSRLLLEALERIDPQ